ncbi:FliO/MopB family protein [Devosia submarina]|uniref:FliO/MopB family protein n=1 Tax=Devosia submarina TaxID=1173082 RepID=UPI000D3913B2|nr:flagellar biosynthetic protein FliO [Devosia submarina]
MQFITSLFGGSGNSWITMLLALGIVVVLIFLAVWLLKFLFNASGNVSRGRHKRLSVVDSLALDPKRHLLIVRRDDVEHLILVGGTQDLVVETGIPVLEEQATQPTRRPVPMVASRRPAAAKNAAPPVETPTHAAVKPLSPGPATVADQLREMGQPTDKKTHLSLRHTGLLRPVSEIEPIVAAENSVIPSGADRDSAKEGRAQRDTEGSDIGGNHGANRI